MVREGVSHAWHHRKHRCGATIWSAEMTRTSGADRRDQRTNLGIESAAVKARLSALVTVVIGIAAVACGSALEPRGHTSRPPAQITLYAIPTRDSNPGSITAGPDGNLWFTETNANKVAKVTVSGTFTEYSIPTPASGPRGIATGPDGNLWLTEDLANKIAKVTTSGAITEYSIPTPASLPWDIVAGPDRNLWFTENHANKVAKITTSGVITEYTTPAICDPLGIAKAADESLWFTVTRAADSLVWPECGGFSVAKVTTSGAITHYPLPGADQLGTVGQPGRIAAGPDGNLWFTQCTWMTAPEVARVTPSGAFTEYRIPFDDIPEACPDGITAGPDGNLWVTMSLGGFVVRLTPAGAFTEYTFPGFSPYRFTTFHSNQGGIATGPDGNLWITGPNDVAKIVP